MPVQLFLLPCNSCIRRFYNNNFIIQGDVLLNLWMHINSALFWNGWDPHFIGYLGWFPVIGKLTPLNMIADFILNIFFHNGVKATLFTLQILALINTFFLGLTFYLLLRFLGRSKFSSVFASIIVMFTGFHSHVVINELDFFYNASFCCVPLVMIFMIKANRASSLKSLEFIKNSILAGFFIGLSLLGGTNVPMFMFLPCFLFIGLIDKPLKEVFSAKELVKVFCTFLIAGIIALFIGASIIIPSLKYMSLTIRDTVLSNDIYLTKPFSYTLFTLLYKDWWPIWIVNEGLKQFHEANSFLGFPVMCFSLIGFSNTKAKAQTFFLGLILFAIMAMHIIYMPNFIINIFDFVYQKLSIRFPYRFAMLFIFAMSYFAAVGFDSLKVINEKLKTTHKLILYSLLNLLFLIYLLVGIDFFIFMKAVELRGYLLTSLIITAIFVLSLNILAFNRYKYSKIIKCNFIILLFCFFYFTSNQYPVRQNYEDADIYKAKQTAYYYPDSLNEQINKLFYRPINTYNKLNNHNTNPIRIYNKNTFQRENVWMSYTSFDSAFESMPDPCVSAYLFKYYNLASNVKESPLLDLYNVKYFQFDEDYTGKKYKKTPVKNIYENPYTFNRFFMVHNAKYFIDESYLMNALHKASYNELKNNVYLITSADSKFLSNNSSKTFDKINIIKKTPTKIILDVKSNKAGYLINSETWFPEWNVKVDNHNRQILRADEAFMGVYIPKGNHTVIFEF